LCKQVRITKVKAARRNVRQRVGRPWDVGLLDKVAVLALVKRSVPQQVAGSPSCGCGGMCPPRDCWSVVGTYRQGAFPDILGGGKCGGVGNGTSEFQVGIGDGARRMCGGHQGLLNFLGECAPPDIWGVGRCVSIGHPWGEPDPSHTTACSVGCPHIGWLRGNNLAQACGAGGKVVGKGGKVAEGVLCPHMQPNSVTVGMSERKLEL
jgi:hypothetical protein